MAYQIECAYTCHMGNVRANNEDNFWCFGDSLPMKNEGTSGIFSKTVSGVRAPAMAVFDGMGGESCGEVAAFLASEEFGKFYNINKRMLRDMPEDFIDGVCKQMNQAVCRYGMKHHIQSMGSTMAMVLFTPESMLACNLGDSRIYLHDGGRMRQVSTDHVINRNMIGKAPLTQYLGLPEEVQMLEPSVAEIEHKEGYKYLLCSDGVTDMLSDREIEEILSQEAELSQIVKALLEKALQKGGRDNVTIILCEVQKLDAGKRLRTWMRSLKDKNER